MLSPFKQEFKLWREKLSHLDPKYMFILEKLGVLPKLFLDLKDDVPLSESLIFGTARILN